MLKGVNKVDIKWDLYNSKLTVYGETRRDRVIYETQHSIMKRSKRSPAYKTVLIDGVEQKVVITSTANLYEKKINALPNENIYAGSIVEWNKRFWIIQYTDCEDEVYQRGIMQQCNIYLKWQNENGDIIGRYGFSEDITQYASGVVNNKLLDNIELSFKINMPLDSETVKLRRGKRFLVDVITDKPNAYILTNRNVNSLNFLPTDIDKGYEFDGKGKILQLTITQTQLGPRDNTELMIADYFSIDEKPDTETHNCNIKFTGKSDIKLGGNYKKFTAEFLDEERNVIDLTPVWRVISTPEAESKLIVEKDGNSIKIKAPDCTELFNTQVKIELSDADNTYYTELYAKVVSLYG